MFHHNRLPEVAHPYLTYSHYGWHESCMVATQPAQAGFAASRSEPSAQG